MKEIPLTKGMVALVDDEDYERIIEAGPWHAGARSQTFYAQSRKGGRHVYMHRLIADAYPGQDVDHVNGEGLDNQKANLRLCTRAQNLGNQRKREGTSSFKGVCWSHNRWTAQMQARGRNHYLGRFSSEEDAARAYDTAALEAWGEFAKLNFPLRYHRKVCVVTGAREGVGKMVAEYFLAQGATVVGMSRGPASIEHPRYEHLSVDIGRNEQVRAAFGEIGKAHGRIHALVNCAAVASSTFALIMPVAGAEEMVMTNVLGLLYVSREAAKLMRREGGRIVNIGSIHSQIAPIGSSVYSATKSAQATMVKVLSKEFSSWNVTCNTLALSPIETSMLRKSGTPDVIQAVIDGLTIPRLAEPDDVFNGIDFFLSDRSGFITGQCVYLGGVHE